MTHIAKGLRAAYGLSAGGQAGAEAKGDADRLPCVDSWGDIDRCLMQLLGCLQVSRLVQMQKETLADERAIVLGEHKAELKTLVSVMSASINRDLPTRIEEMVGRAVRLYPGPLTFCLQTL